MYKYVWIVMLVIFQIIFICITYYDILRSIEAVNRYAQDERKSTRLKYIYNVLHYMEDWIRLIWIAEFITAAIIIFVTSATIFAKSFGG